VSCACEI
jgi:hypothetical protein